LERTLFLLNGGASVYIITKNLKTKLTLPKPRRAPYNFRMPNQSMIRPLGIIKKLKIRINGISYGARFNVLQNNVVNSSYSMLLGRPWLINANVKYDWANNVITNQGNGTVRTISS
jgi:hypothetical protein